MAFSGLSTNKAFTATTVGEDISPLITRLALHAAPFLDWVGDSNVFAISTKHEFIEDQIRPIYLTTSTAVASNDGSATGIRIKEYGDALTVGTILENTSAAPELMQVTSAVGPYSVLVARAFDGASVGSLAAGQKIRVRWPAALEGADHDGSNAQILGVRRANAVGLFHIPVAASGTAMAVNLLGGDSFASNRAKLIAEAPYRLEEAVLTSAYASNSLGTTAITRTMQGVRPQITGINSQVVVTSFATPAYCGPIALAGLFESVFDAGGNPGDDWALVCGRTTYNNISNLNSTRVNVIQGGAANDQYMQRVTVYDGPFGQARVILSRALEATDLLLVPRQRVKVVPLQGRAFQYVDIAKSGDNQKGLILGEYTVEVHHPAAMGRIRANG